MKTTYIEKKPVLKAFMDIVKIVNNTLEIESIRDEDHEQNKPLNTLAKVMEQIEKHPRREQIDIVRSIYAYYNRYDR